MRVLVPTAVRAVLVLIVAAAISLLAVSLSVVPTAAVAQNLLGLVPSASDGTSSQGAADDTSISETDLQSLRDLLQDDARRTEFLAHLDTLLTVEKQDAETPDQGLVQRFTLALSRSVDRVSRRTITGVDAVFDLRRLGNQLGALVADSAVRDRWIEIALKLLVILGMAAAAFVIARRIVRQPRERLADRYRLDPVSRLTTLALRMLLDLGPIVAFAIVAYAILPLTEPRPFTRIVGISAINVTIAIQLALLVARAVFTPYSPQLRVLPLADENAAYGYVWVRRFCYLGGYVFVVSGALGLLGFSEVGTVVADIGGLVLGLMTIVVILQNRAVVRRRLRGRPEDSRPPWRTLRRQFAEVWHILAVLYVIGVYIVWALQIPGGFGYVLRGTVATIVITAVSWISFGILTTAVERGFNVGARLHEQYPSLQRRANRYLPVLRVGTIVVILLVAVLATLQAWQVPVGAWLAGEFGGSVVSGAITVVLVLTAAIFLWELISSSIERYLDMTDDDGVVVERTARERTLLPLLRNAILIVLIVVVGLIVLSELGLNIAPLLAAAGVVGIAIGFGSQKLVQDVINGLFILFEDTISVGDVVDVAGHRGLVESLSVRNLTLRDLEGNVHTVPFSEVATIRNMSKEFSFALLEVGIAYRENVAEVIEVLKQIGAELEADPSIGALILEPIEILGLDEFGDSAIIVKARLKTVPLKQWSVRRAYNLRMKERFDELGIEIPFPHMTLYFGEDKAGRAPPVNIVNQRAPAPQAPTQSNPAVGEISEVSNAPASSDE